MYSARIFLFLFVVSISTNCFVNGDKKETAVAKWKGNSQNERNCRAYTTDGRVCSIPFVYKGVNYTKCTDVDRAPGKFWCSLTPDYDADEKWAPCAGVNCDDCKVYTTEGQQCVFPFSYKGETYNYCTDIDSPNGLLWCSHNPVFDGQWGQCMDTLCGNCTVHTQWDNTCQFPFHYCGAERHHCVMGEDGKPWCSLNGYTTYQGVDWDYCMPTQCSEKPELPFSAPPVKSDDNCLAFTTTGRECSLPFTYKGTTYANATDVDNLGVKWCSLTPDFDSDGQWQNYAGSICEGCTVLTTIGVSCHLPFEYKGRTFDYCTTVDEERLWCSTDPVFNGTWGFCDTEKTVCGPVSYQACLSENPAAMEDICIPEEMAYGGCKYQFTPRVPCMYTSLDNSSDVCDCQKLCDDTPGCRSFAFGELEDGYNCRLQMRFNGSMPDLSERYDVYWRPNECIAENDLRLADPASTGFSGKTIVSGRLEIYHKGEWGSVCLEGEDVWTSEMSTRVSAIACGQMRNISFLDQSEPSSEKFAMSDVQCDEEVKFLHDCDFPGWYHNTCSQDEGISLSCTKTEDYQYNGESFAEEESTD